MLYLHCSENAMDLKGNAHKVLKQFVKIIKRTKSGTRNQSFSTHSVEKAVEICCNCFITPGIQYSGKPKSNTERSTQLYISPQAEPGITPSTSRLEPPAQNGICRLFGRQLCFLAYENTSFFQKDSLCREFQA